ncbi:hypothetical protein JKP88DRAFT_193537, partial [Tribonema minus]
MEAAALTLHGLHAGAMLFVSTVTARTLMKACSNKDEDLIKRFFPIWWPAGRDLMLPLGVACCALWGTHYARARVPHAAAAAAAVGFTVAWTGLAMMEDIDALRRATGAGVLDITRRFCARHHVRTVASLASFA